VVCLGRYTPPFFGGSCQTLLMFGKKKVSDMKWKKSFTTVGLNNLKKL